MHTVHMHTQNKLLAHTLIQFNPIRFIFRSHQYKKVQEKPTRMLATTNHMHMNEKRERSKERVITTG